MKGKFIKERYVLIRAKNKDPEAFSQVYDIYVDRIYRFIFFKVSSREEAQDLTSEVFLKTWQYIIDGKDIKNLNALIYKVARNLVIDHYRKKSTKDVPLEPEILDSKQELIFDQVEKMEKKLKIESIENKLKDLKDEYREMIILRYVDGLSIKEIAEIVEKKNGHVRVILYRAMNTLRELLEEGEK